MAGDDARDVFWQDRWWGKGGIQSSKEYEVVKEKKKNRRCSMLQGTVVCRMIWFSGSIPVCVDILTECTQSHSGGLSSVLDTVCPPSNYSLATLFFFFFPPPPLPWLASCRRSMAMRRSGWFKWPGFSIMNFGRG